MIGQIGSMFSPDKLHIPARTIDAHLNETRTHSGEFTGRLEPFTLESGLDRRARLVVISKCLFMFTPVSMPGILNDEFWNDFIACKTYETMEAASKLHYALLDKFSSESDLVSS